MWLKQNSEKAGDVVEAKELNKETEDAVAADELNKQGKRASSSERAQRLRKIMHKDCIKQSK